MSKNTTVSEMIDEAKDTIHTIRHDLERFEINEIKRRLANIENQQQKILLRLDELSNQKVGIEIGEF